MVGSLLPEPKQQFLNDIGDPLFAGKVFTYEAGTLTPKATYQDQALTIANTNPVIANARGEVVMYGSGTYRIILQDLFGNTIYDRDDVQSPDQFAVLFSGNLSQVGGAALVGSAAWYAPTISGFDATKVPDGASVIFIGRDSVTDSGGGVFTYSKNSTQTTDGGMVHAPTGGGRLIRNGWTVLGYNGVPHVRFWGAKPDKSEGAGLSLAVNWANANRCNLDVSNGNYGTNTSLKLSVFWRFIGNKTGTITALAVMTSVLAIGPDQLGAQDNSASNYNMGSLDGITVDANALATYAAFYGGGEYNVTGYQTRDCKFINSNSDAVKTGENFFINQFFGCAFNNCSGNGFYLGRGNNAGENISFYGCGFFNNGQSGIFCQNSGPGGASVNLHGCSYDYNQNWAIENGTTTANGTLVSVFGGHIENFKQYALNYGTLNFTDVAMFGGAQSGTLGYLIDNQGGMTIRGGWIQNSGSGVLFNPAGLPYYTPDPVINVPSSYPLMQVGAGGPLVPTTIYQNKTGAYMELSVPFTFGAGAGRVLGFVGPVSAEFLVASRTGNSNSVEEYLTIRVPPFYFYQVNISGSAGLSAGHIYSYG